jgi:hypothetical protein
MDTTFVKTSRLEYRSDLSTAYFGYGTDMWQDDNMLSANDGWYDRNKELFFFRRNVHLLTKDQESWSDTLYYHRPVNDVEMMGNVELMDTTRNVFGLAGRVDYTDSLSRVKMTRQPAVMSISEEKNRRDTLYFGADTILYRAIRRNKVDSLWKVSADRRLSDLQGDPVTEYRRKAAEEAAKAAEEAARQMAAGSRDRGPGGGKPMGGPPAKGSGMPATPEPQAPPMDTTALMPVDSTAAPVVIDSTQLSFLWGINHVKLYRDDMQMSCDSLVYNDLDSLVRLYRDPLVFSDGNRQYAADSIYVIIRNQKAERARLMANAFITTEEAVDCYDQIRGTEMMAYFDTTRALTRFDALGGASALFFLQENDALATVNKVESKMLYALFEKGDLDKVYYFEEAKNDAYPVVQLPKEERYMKGFRWNPERRPTGKEDITPLNPRKSQRTSYLARPHAQFKETEIYFPGHIKKIHKEIALRDSLAVVRARQPKKTPEPKAVAPSVSDTLAVPQDTLAALRDTMAAGSGPVRDSLSVFPDSLAVSADSLSVPTDSLSVPETARDSLDIAAPKQENTPELDPLSAKREAEKAAEKARKAEEKRLKEEQRRIKAEEKARVQAEKQAAREAKWAEEDKAYEAKQAAKAQKKLEKERKQKLRALRKLEKKAQKERRIFERYLEKERAKADKKAAREAEKARKAAEKAAQEAESTQ